MAVNAIVSSTGQVINAFIFFVVLIGIYAVLGANLFAGGMSVALSHATRVLSGMQLTCL